jgi:integrase
MAERIRIDHGSLEAGLRLLQQWKVPQSVKRELFSFLDDLALGKVNRGKKLSPERQLKYLYALRMPLEFFNKTTARLTLRDIEDFEKALGTGQIRNQINGKPFAHSTQVDMRMLLRIFLRWRLGAAKALSLTNWLDTRCRPKTPDFLKEADVEKLYKDCRNAQERFLVAVLFDSGARAEEFHNIRFEDISLPAGKENLVRIALKQEYSKTLGRIIALYWKFSPEAVTDYLAERVAQGIKPADPVFQGNYQASKKRLQRLGKRVLQRAVYYHLFRHSSATYYATQLNRQELCYRYGWRFSSNMPDIYISRAGMETKQLDEKFNQTKMATLQDNMTKMEQEAKINHDRIKQMEQAAKTDYDRIKQLEESTSVLREKVDMISRVLSLNPTIGEVEDTLRRKQRVQGDHPGQPAA